MMVQMNGFLKMWLRDCVHKNVFQSFLDHLNLLLKASSNQIDLIKERVNMWIATVDDRA